MITDIALVGIFCIAIFYAYIFVKNLVADDGA